MNQKAKGLNNAYRKVMNIIGLLGIAGMIVFLLLMWDHLPDEIPQHFNMAGQADRWGGKLFLLSMPLAAVILFTVITILERHTSSMNAGFKVTAENRAVIYDEMKNMIAAVKTVLVLIFFYIIVAVAFEKNLGVWFAFAVIVLISGPILMYYVRVKLKMAELGASNHGK